MSKSVGDIIDDGGDKLKENADGLKTGAKKVIHNVALEVKQIAKTQTDNQLNNLADLLVAFSDALQKVGQSAIGSGRDKSQEYGNRITDSVRDVAKSLREKDMKKILHDTDAYARARPVAYLIITVALGFLTARFLKNMTPSQVSKSVA